MMKTLVIALGVLFSSITVLGNQGSFIPDVCCSSFQINPLKMENVMCITNTSRACAKDGVLFKMRKGAELCVDPSMKWVDRIIQSKKMDQCSKKKALLKGMSG